MSSIYLMRHCTAEPHQEMEADRALTSQGKAEARMMGRFLRDSGIHIDLILTSDFKRAHQTAKRVANRVDAPLVTCEALRPDWPDRNVMEAVWDEVEKLLGDAERVLIVTHGPLIQDLRDWVSGDPVGASRFGEHWIYGSICKIQDGKAHWTVTPKLVSKILGDEDKLEKSARRFVENLKRANKARIIDPLVSKLTAATKRRFQLQGRAVARAIHGRLREALKWHILTEADTAAARQAASHALSGFPYAAWLAVQRKATAAAYGGGAGIAAGMLDANEPDNLGGPDRTAETAEQEIDITTRDRVLAAILDGMESAAILAAVALVFKDGVDSRADVIALHEVSDAFHQGMTDAAEAISLDIGEDIEKQWEAEDDACEDCLDCEDEGWVDLDFTYPAFGVDEPDGHPNCRCSLSLRRAGTE